MFPFELWTATSGDLVLRRSTLPTPIPVTSAGTATPIVIDPSLRRQDWMGVGAAITDATAALIWTSMDECQRTTLLQELFDPVRGAGFSMIRIPIGSCDFNAQDYYTYDDVPFGRHDVDLESFSIGEGTPGSADATKDLRYIVPVVREILCVNPGVKILASPWSAPAWMKNTGSLTHGGHLRFGEWTGYGYDSMHDSFEGVYARYLTRFVEEYERLGIPIHALTIQNEPACASPWPAMTWTLEELATFGHGFLRPELRRHGLETKLYYLDDNPSTLHEPLRNIITDEQAAAFDGIAVHTYAGPYDNLDYALGSFPHWTLMMTERRCMMEESVEDASHIMFGVNCNWLIRRGMSAITLWNLALDERGLPNRAGSTGRRGVITIEHGTGNVRRNLEYYMLRNVSQGIAPGSQVIGSSNYTANGYDGGLGAVAFMGPDGTITGVLYNPSSEPIEAAVTVNGIGASWQHATVPPYGTVTLQKSTHAINDSAVPNDADFPLDPVPAHFAGDKAPGKE